MTTKEILNLDYYENQDVFQKALRKIKPFEKYPEGEEIPLEDLEKLISRYEYKYALMLQYICPLYIQGERNVYSASIKRSDTQEHLGYIYGSTFYELFVKLCFKYYTEVKHGIPIRG